MDKKKLLNEELKRFNMLNEYSFYVPEGDDPKGSIDDLLLSEEDPEETAPEDEADIEGLANDIDTEVDSIDGDEPAIDEPTTDAPADDMGFEDAPADDMGVEDLSVDEPENVEELDVTELVASTDEAKAAAADANNKVDQLMGMVSKLEAQLGDINAIGVKIDNLGHELEKRAPTPEEKIEMRSLDSYPYNLKLTDFWKTKEGKYDVMNNDESDVEPTEYTLTRDDVNSDYSESRIKSSLDTSNPYEEEDI